MRRTSLSVFLGLLRRGNDAHIVKLDQAAPSAEQALTETVATTASQMGWRPIRPLTVKVYSDTDAAIAAYQRYLIGLLPGETPESLAQQVRDGVTWYAPNLDGVISNLLCSI